MTELINENMIQTLDTILMYLICCFLLSVVLTWAHYFITGIIIKKIQDAE